MTVRAARGAIKVTEDSPPCVLDATERLVRALLEANAAAGDDLISMLFTVTDDIASAFPAEAVRRMGLGAVPLMCAREIPVVGSMPLVVRVLMHLHRAVPRGASGLPRRPSRCVMTSAERVAVVGTGLIGTSVALAAARTGAVVTGWDADVRDRTGRRLASPGLGSVEERSSRPDRRRRDPRSPRSPPPRTCLEAAPGS
jgi:chorismate mutase